jgi:hypothetical protein
MNVIIETSSQVFDMYSDSSSFDRTICGIYFWGAGQISIHEEAILA